MLLLFLLQAVGAKEAIKWNCVTNKTQNCIQYQIYSYVCARGWMDSQRFQVLYYSILWLLLLLFCRRQHLVVGQFKCKRKNNAAIAVEIAISLIRH